MNAKSTAHIHNRIFKFKYFFSLPKALCVNAKVLRFNLMIKPKTNLKFTTTKQFTNLTFVKKYNLHVLHNKIFNKIAI